MSDIATAYACTDCYIMAHDPSHVSPGTALDHADIRYTDWVCVDCIGFDYHDTGCTSCDDTGTGHGTTVGGTCDLGEHDMPGYWEYHTYIA